VAQSFVHVFVSYITNNLSPIMTLAVVLATVYGLWTIIRHSRRHWWLIGWCSAYLAIYSSLKVFPFPWYLVPPLAALMMIWSIGIGHLLGDGREMTPVPSTETDAANRRPGSSGRNGKLFASAGVGLLVALTLGVASWVRISDATNVRGHPRWSDYYQTAQWLAENAHPDSTVATIEIGIIGYYSRLRILDTMGLVDKDVAQRLTGWSDTLVYATTSKWPDYAVVVPDTAWGVLLSQWWFEDYYHPVASFPAASENLGPTTVHALVNPPVTRYSAKAQADYITGLTLAHVDFNDQTLQPGASLDLWLQFQVLTPQPSDYQFTVYLIDTETSERTALTTLWPYYISSAYPTSHWMSGDTRAVPVRLTIPEDLPPGTYRLGVLVYDPKQDRMLPLTTNPDSDNPEVQVGYLRLGQPPGLADADDFSVTPAQADWEGYVALKGVGLPVKSPVAGDVLPVRLEWQAIAAPERDATVFLHLIDESGKIVAQRDQRPFAGRFPLPAWQTGEVLQDLYLISLPSELPSGQYSLKIGLYDGGGRLARSDVTDSTMSQDPVTVRIEVRDRGN